MEKYRKEMEREREKTKTNTHKMFYTLTFIYLIIK